MGSTGCAPSESWVKKGRAYTGKKGCSYRSKWLWIQGLREICSVYAMQGRGKLLWNNGTGQETAP